MKKQNLILIIFILGIFFALVGEAKAANHYIRAGATGSNTGTDWTNAYTRIPIDVDYANTWGADVHLIRGDVYYIADGTYIPDVHSARYATGGIDFSSPVDGIKNITIKKATIGDHGTETGWDNAYGDGQAEITGQLNFTTSNWIFDGSTGGGVGNWYGTNPVFGFKINIIGNFQAIRLEAVNNITLSHLEVLGDKNITGGGAIAQDGLAIFGGTNITLSYYYIREVGRCPFFLTPVNGFVAEHGVTGKFYSRPDPDGMHSELASIWNGSNDVTFRYNLFTYTHSTGGIGFDNQENPSGAGMKVYGNIFYRPLTGDLSGWSAPNGVISAWTGANSPAKCGGGCEEFHNVWVYNNSFINLNVPALTISPKTFSGNRAYNNLFYNCTTSPDFTKFETHDYNHFINSGGTHSEANGTSATNGDPFVNFANLDFSLKAATEDGLHLNSPFNADILGNSRGGATGTEVWDRGAYEYTTACANKGDFNTPCNGYDATDIQTMINIILNIEQDSTKVNQAKMNAGDSVDATDLQLLINKVLGIN